VRLADYLARIGVPQPLPATVDTLRKLHVAHLSTFVFENLTIQRGGVVRTDLASIEEKFLGGAGGYCFEQNTLFGAALRELGFTVFPTLGRVGSPERRALNHLVLRVEIEAKPWLADVGFGGEGILEPIPIADGTRVMQGGIEYSLRRDGHHWHLHMREEHMYEFGDAPHTDGDIAIANWYTTTHPDSIFRKSFTIQRLTPHERVILRPKVMTRYVDGVRTDVPIESAADVRRYARELFGIELGDAPLLYERQES
jgi:N-hydroxyarylamine O-acetyltransferase